MGLSPDTTPQTQYQGLYKVNFPNTHLTGAATGHHYLFHDRE
jgi:hypothetical protein